MWALFLQEVDLGVLRHFVRVGWRQGVGLEMELGKGLLPHRGGLPEQLEEDLL